MQERENMMQNQNVLWFFYSIFSCVCASVFLSLVFFLPSVQKPANILVMGEGPERGRVKIGTTSHLSYSILVYGMNNTRSYF